jgi:potassium-dependent mechanosensitive channel
MNVLAAGLDGVAQQIAGVGRMSVNVYTVLFLLLLTAFTWLCARLLRRAMERMAAHGAAQNRAAYYAVGRVSRYALIAAAVAVGLEATGINLSSLAFAAGALGVGIGLGLQQIVNNFVSGLVLLFERTIKVGDFVQLEGGLQGTVLSINVRSTVLTTNDNLDVVVPNSMFINNVMTNWTMRDARRRLHVPFSVAYGTDKERVRTAALEAATRVELTEGDGPRGNSQVWLVGFGESSLNFELVVWVGSGAVGRPGNTRARYLWELETSLREHGIEIPFPQRDLHLRSGFDHAARIDGEAAAVVQPQPVA